jgi:hypothetical protein
VGYFYCRSIQEHQVPKERIQNDRSINVFTPPSPFRFINPQMKFQLTISFHQTNRPGQEGPSFAPPPLPAGWIAQWDGMSKKYYFVQLSTGASQWDTPTQPAPTGPTPQATPQGVEHPYGLPGVNESNHGFGDNTQQHGGEVPADGTRGGPDGERGIGVSFTFAF